MLPWYLFLAGYAVCGILTVFLGVFVGYLVGDSFYTSSECNFSEPEFIDGKVTFQYSYKPNYLEFAVFILWPVLSCCFAAYIFGRFLKFVSDKFFGFLRRPPRRKIDSNTELKLFMEKHDISEDDANEILQIIERR